MINSRSKKVVRNFIVLAILLVLLSTQTGLYLNPLSAHKLSERRAHYGPSKIIKIVDFDNGKDILCKYDKWFSCDTVNRSSFFLWRFGNSPFGIENDRTKTIVFSWDMSNQHWKLYGIINDDRIKKIQVTFENGKILTQTKFYDDLFLFTMKSDNKNIYYKSIIAYDSDNNVIFEDKIYK